MRKILKLFFGLAASSIFGIFLISCQDKGNEKTEAVGSFELDTIAVHTAYVLPRNISLFKFFTGTIEGEEQAYLVAKISERIVEINVKVGDYVQKGSLLVELDKSGAASQYYQAEAGYQNAKKNLDRMKALFDEGAVSAQMLDGAQTAYNIAKANFEAAKGLVELTSPISGIVAEVNAEVGDLSSPGMRIITIAKINKVKSIFNVGEQDIMSLKVNQEIEVLSELRPDLIKKGHIIQISKSADIDSRTFQVKGLFSNTKDNWFKPGMFCKVKINLKNQLGSLAIPSSAIILNGNDTGVFVIKNGKAEFRKVTVGIRDDNYTEIINGLNEKEEVVTLGMNKLNNGTPVRIVQ